MSMCACILESRILRADLLRLIVSSANMLIYYDMWTVDELYMMVLQYFLANVSKFIPTHVLDCELIVMLYLMTGL